MEKSTGLAATAATWDLRSMWSSAPFLRIQKTGSHTLPSLEYSTDARLLEHRASLVILAEDFSRARTRMEAIVVEQGGYSSEVKAVNPTEEGRALAAALKVPAANLAATLNLLRKLGRVQEESHLSTDVTENHTDLSARLSNARRTEQRLLEILARRTGNLSDVIHAETKISEVRESIEKMERDLTGMNSRIAFAAIELRIIEDYRARLGLAGAPPATRAWNSLVSGLTTAVESLAAFGLFLLEYLPAILLWSALLFFPARFALRRLRRAAQFAEQRL